MFRQWDEDDETMGTTHCNKCNNDMGIYPHDKSCIKGIEINAYLGFGSKRDGERHMFHLCDDCFDNLISLFITPTDIKGYDF